VEKIPAPAAPDLCPSRVLLEREGAVAREFQAGDQGAGNGGAAAQRPAGFGAIEERQECRQRTAAGRAGDQPADVRESGGGRGR
jgi:hypothetical protein